VQAVRRHSHLRRQATRRWRSETCRRMGKDSKTCFFPAEQQHGHTHTRTRTHTQLALAPGSAPYADAGARAHLVKVHVLDLDLIVHRVSHLEHTPRPASALHTVWSSRKQERLGRLSHSGKQERGKKERTTPCAKARADADVWPPLSVWSRPLDPRIRPMRTFILVALCVQARPRAASPAPARGVVPC
jgi:hypothetical protein